ncbi:hypothetical protein AK830_g8218 [Neonectria ditissima]|uniref:NACHT domain-containing protein n=1 Tax=Neonectria ditissima TaxID=78410 RepID=A0A0P7AKS3_9HYPO|nr:hypothetical protein AK830_g8218 [Neonectria ditissima]
MSGLEALGLACNIFQAISFGRETVSLIKTVYRDGSVDDSLEANAKDLSVLSSRVRAMASLDKQKRQNRQLLEIAERCQAAARDLQEEIDFIMGERKKGSLRTTIKVAMKANWRKRRLNDIERKLSNAEKLMQSGLLARVCDKLDAMRLDWTSLDTDVRFFLKQYRQGHRKTSDLISTESFRTRNHVTAEADRVTSELRLAVTQQTSSLDKAIHNSTRTISTAMAALSLGNDRKHRYERLLGSLKFPGMNERRNQVQRSHAGTFKWIFKNHPSCSDIDSEDENSESDREIDDTETERSESADSNQGEISNDSKESYDNRWDSFTGWLKSSNRIYWCSGKLGSGKSTLMKYIISDPRTQKALDVWNPGALLVSHFFWRPGNPMQQSIRGLFCSLLFQLLENDEAFLDHVLSTIPQTQRKDSETDWATDELQELCFHVMRQYRQPICLFLDGLDEVSTDDGVVHLLKVIHKFVAIPKVKACLASRPDRAISKRLGGGLYPSLRLQDLTFKDLRKYAKSNLELPPELKITVKLGQSIDLLSELIESAEGVFLWLCLAIRSLNRGLEHRNSPEELQQRIRSLPKSLADMYKDLWERLNEDKLLYHRKAALYFGFVIAKQSWQDRHWYETELNVFSMMLASTEMGDQLLGPHSEEIQLHTLVAACRDTENDVLTRCAGLLELSHGLQWPGAKAMPWNSEIYGTSLPFVTSTKSFQFIHRSAHDFLVSTEEGRTITSHCKFSAAYLQRRILQARLATYQLAMVSIDLYIKPEGLQYLFAHCRNDLSHCLTLIEEWKRHFSMELGDEKQDYHQLIQTCERLSSSGRLFYFLGHPRNILGHLPRGGFLAATAHLDCVEWLLAIVENRNLESDVLSKILFEKCRSLHGLSETGEILSLLVHKLLEKGADANKRFAVTDHSILNSMVETTLSVMVKKAFTWEAQSPEGLVGAYLKVLQHCVQVGANFEQSVCLYIDVYGQDDSLHFCSCPDLERHFTKFFKCGRQDAEVWIDRFKSPRDDSALGPVFQEDGWTIWATMPASDLIKSTLSGLSRYGLHSSLEADKIMRQLNAIVKSGYGHRAHVIGLDKSNQRGTTAGNYIKVSPQDSVYLTELITKSMMMERDWPVSRDGTKYMKAEGLGKRLDEVVARSIPAKEGIADRVKRLGFAEPTVYVDGDGVEYPREVAKKMAPDWISKTGYFG